MAGPLWFPPSPHGGRRGGEAWPGGVPRLSSGRGAAAFSAPPDRGCGTQGMHPTGARGAGTAYVCGHTRVGYTHACAGTYTEIPYTQIPYTHHQVGYPPSCTPARVSTLLGGEGDATRVCGHSGVDTRRGRAHTRVSTWTRVPDTHSPSANAPPPLPSSGSLGHPPSQAVLPRPLHLVSPNSPAFFPHSPHPTQLKPAAEQGCKGRRRNGKDPATRSLPLHKVKEHRNR